MTTRTVRKLAARRRRAARIRKTVAGLAVSLFLAFFAGISAQMATGSDPVLSAQRTTTPAPRVGAGAGPARRTPVPRRPARATARRPAATTRTARSGGTAAAPTRAPVAPSAPTAPSAPVAPVTTRQS